MKLQDEVCPDNDHQSLLDGMIGTIAFLSTLPVGSDRLMEVRLRTYLFPAVGIFMGLILGGVAAVLPFLFPPGLIAVLVIISIYLLAGFHHLDALSDFGDGITAHGSREKKIGAMKDTALGTGGAAFIILSMLLLYVIIQAVAEIPSGGVFLLGISLFAAEVASKQSILTVAWLGRPIHQGMGSMTADHTGRGDFLVGLVISGLVLIAALGVPGFLALVFAMLSSLLVIVISNRHFGGINGDCMGTANEMGRLTALLTLLMLFSGGWDLWMPW